MLSSFKQSVSILQPSSKLSILKSKSFSRTRKWYISKVLCLMKISLFVRCCTYDCLLHLLLLPDSTPAGWLASVPWLSVGPVLVRLWNWPKSPSLASLLFSPQEKCLGWSVTPKNSWSNVGGPGKGLDSSSHWRWIPIWTCAARWSLSGVGNPGRCKNHWPPGKWRHPHHPRSRHPGCCREVRRKSIWKKIAVLSRFEFPIFYAFLFLHPEDVLSFMSRLIISKF